MIEVEYLIGDVIRNKKPYDNEPSYIVKSYDKYGYICGTRQTNGRVDIKNTHSIFFHEAHLHYTKIDDYEFKNELLRPIISDAIETHIEWAYSNNEGHLNVDDLAGTICQILGE